MFDVTVSREQNTLCRSKRNIQHNRQTAICDGIIGTSDDEDDDEVHDYERYDDD